MSSWYKKQTPQYQRSAGFEFQGYITETGNTSGKLTTKNLFVKIKRLLCIALEI
jgi:hypothetical protein